MIVFTHYPECVEVVVGKKSDRTCKHWFCSDFSMSDDSMILYDENKEQIITFNQSEYHFKPICKHNAEIKPEVTPEVPYNATTILPKVQFRHEYISIKDMNGVK